MNQKTENLIRKIENEIKDASLRFELLLNMWGTDDNKAILDQVAGNVFLQFRNSLLETVVIGVNRLCDQAQDGRGNENLSLERLRNSLPQESEKDKAFQQELLELERKIRKEVKKLNAFRSKRVAHNDYPTHMNNWYQNIPTSSIDQSLEMMEEFVRKIHQHFDNCDIHILDITYPCGDGPDRLMDHLKRALQS